MSGKDELCAVRIGARVVKQVYEMSNYQWMQARIEFINNKNSAVPQNIQQGSRHTKHLLCAVRFLFYIKFGRIPTFRFMPNKDLRKFLIGHFESARVC